MRSWCWLWRFRPPRCSPPCWATPTAVAVGSPFGLDYTRTAGNVSAVHRSWASGSGPTAPMIPTAAPINPGNAGGPLFNRQGEVIGIVMAIESPIAGLVGVGFAIPINRIKTLLP